MQERLAELSNRSSNGQKVAGNGGPDVSATTPPTRDAGRADPGTPVPDYTEGQFRPNSPAPGYPLSDTAAMKRLPLKGSFGPGFQFQTEDEEFQL